MLGMEDKITARKADKTVNNLRSRIIYNYFVNFLFLRHV